MKVIRNCVEGHIVFTSNVFQNKNENLYDVFLLTLEEL